MVIAIVGATGLVGSEIIKVLEEKKIKKIKEVLFVATQKSVGKIIIYNKQTYKIITIKEALQNQILLFFSRIKSF